MTLTQTLWVLQKDDNKILNDMNNISSWQAFSMAEKHFGIPVVLDASDMIENTTPDKLSVITYVSQLYEYFKNRTPGMWLIWVYEIATCV